MVVDDTQESHNPILDVLDSAADFVRAGETLDRGKGPVAAFGLPEPHKAHIAASLARKHTVLLVSATDTGAIRLYEDLEKLTGNALLFLTRETPLVHVCAVSGERREQRVNTLSRLVLGEASVVVASAAAVMQKLAPRDLFAAMVKTLHPGDEIAPRALVALLVSAGYERVEMVEGRGQTAMRGDILDVYAPQERYPYRIEFFGDEIDQIRSFDPVTQRSVEQVLEAFLPPAFETPQDEKAIARALPKIKNAVGFAEQLRCYEQGMPSAGADALIPLLYPHPGTVFDYLPKDALVLIDEVHRVEDAARTAELTFSEMVAAQLERGEGLSEQGKLQLGAAETLTALNTGRTLLLYTLTRSHPAFSPKEIVDVSARQAPQYLGNAEELARDVRLWKKNRDAAVLYAGTHAGQLCDQLQDQGVEVAVTKALTHAPVRGEVLVVEESLCHGFAYPELHLAVLSEIDLFAKADRAKRPTKKKNGLQFSDLAVGDYIVHEAHGIGRFVGVEALTVENNTRDYLLIEYRGGDRLYIPTDQLDRVQKYIGGGDEDVIPPLSKLGGSDWQSRVTKAKQSAKKLAVDLAALYAKRAGNGGFAYTADSAWQRQFEERFPYTETPDQLQSIKEIKKDMESPRPMDRLLCGDVGYGKTEVALRAAFKAVQDSKQVAFLVPTTILAQQHYNTMAARYADFPVKVACMSRFRTNKEKAEIKKQLESGALDIVVGTHALLAKDVRFKDLGLLIIDEEQRFGVNHKEQIKALRSEVDVLTLTATPIPRTLNLSMTGIRDISVIETPPEERFPVQTFVLEYTEALVVDAVTREMARGGQTYIVYNRVQNMEAMAARLEQLLPEAHIIFAHGQMSETQLEQAMLDFMDQKADVLLCSTIIESGLDIPNANTMIVIDADRMGLAQLYQLRGRVGRSTRLGYAYFTVQQSRSMNEKAAKRLMAIREFTQFGAGFQLAMRDLEIRGAGSLLGAEQHGHIADIGYEYYCKLMREAVQEAKGEAVRPETDTVVDIPIDAHIPRPYIRNEVQRLAAYKRIAAIDGHESYQDMQEELIDRYGEPPLPVENLLLVSLVKAYAKRALLEQVAVRDGEVTMKFVADAAIDGGKLIGVISRQGGAQLAATEPPAIKIVEKKADALRLTQVLPEFLRAVGGCVEME